MWRGEEKEIVRGVLLGGELSEIGRDKSKKRDCREVGICKLVK